MTIENIARLPLNQAKEAVLLSFDIGVVPLLLSSPGMGKSSIHAQIAEERNLKMIDLRLGQCDPTDLMGFPFMNHQTGLASYYPMDTFPLTSTPLPPKLDGNGQVMKDDQGNPTYYNGWLLFLDELTSANEAVQAAAYKLILDRMVGNHHLHKQVFISAAGNEEGQNAIVTPMSTALVSRVTTIYVDLPFKDWWENYARDNGIDMRIAAYLNWRPHHFDNFKDTVEERTPFGCGRTWTNASKIIKKFPNGLTSVTRALLDGTIGLQLSVEFNSFLAIYSQLPNIDNILANPETAPLVSQDRMDIMYALMGSLVDKTNKTNSEAVLKYVARQPLEMQMFAVKSILADKDKKMDFMKTPTFIKWSKDYAKDLFAM
jgi:hypothetical protein